MVAELITLMMLTNDLLTTQTWEYEYDGEVYSYECDVLHMNEAEIVTLDGQVIRILN